MKITVSTERTETILVRVVGGLKKSRTREVRIPLDSSSCLFLTPSTSNSCLCVINNRLPRLARYLQAVFIVTNSFGSLNKLET